MIQIKTESEIALMRAAGLVVGRTLDKLKAAVAPGMSTADLDAIAEEAIRGEGAIHKGIEHGILKLTPPARVQWRLREKIPIHSTEFHSRRLWRNPDSTRHFQMGLDRPALRSRSMTRLARAIPNNSDASIPVAWPAVAVLQMPVTPSLACITIVITPSPMTLANRGALPQR